MSESLCSCGQRSVPYRAVKLKRVGVGIELSPKYFLDSIAYCQAAERELNMPDLFGALEHKLLTEDVEIEAGPEQTENDDSVPLPPLNYE